MKRFLFSIALLFTALAGCSNHEGESAAPKSELNVMSYNIRYANASDKGDAAWDARKEASVTMIRDVKPDVIGMQEPRFSQAQYLIGELTEYEHYYLAPDDKDSQHRNAVWWRKDRFEMLAQGYFFLNEKDITQPIKGWGHNQFRTALWVKLRERSTGKEFFFFNTHLAHRASPVEGGDIDQVARTESVKLIVEQMKQIAGRYAPIFVTGDMNASYAAGDGRRTCLDGFFEFMWSARETARRRSRRRLQLQQLRRRHSALYVEHRPHLLPQGDARPVPHHQQRRLRRSLHLGPLPDSLHVGILMNTACGAAPAVPHA